MICMDSIGQIRVVLLKRNRLFRFKNVIHKQQMILRKFWELEMFKSRPLDRILGHCLHQSGLN